MTIIETDDFAVDLKYTVHVEDFYDYTKKSKSEKDKAKIELAESNYNFDEVITVSRIVDIHDTNITGYYKF